MGTRHENSRKDGVVGAGTHGLGVTEAKEYIMDDDDTIIPDPDKDPDEDLKDVTPLEEYFERIRQAYGIELVGIIELRDARNEADDRKGRGGQLEDKENGYDA